MNPHLPHGHHGVESSLSVMPFLGTFLLLLLLVLVALYLWHRASFPCPNSAATDHPKTRRSRSSPNVLRGATSPPTSSSSGPAS